MILGKSTTKSRAKNKFELGKNRGVKIRVYYEVVLNRLIPTWSVGVPLFIFKPLYPCPCSFVRSTKIQ